MLKNKIKKKQFRKFIKVKKITIKGMMNKSYGKKN